MPRITCITSSPRNCPIERIICFCWFISLMTVGSFLFRPCPPGGMELLMSTPREAYSLIRISRRS